eukprot:TRINITY_DN3661_c0_g1_i9.p1 TRINITY_DN3661_c0_g1~~TRINITY_DN3661_c0_g1_i9.p1  ORF type:complete len:256 (+),score=77.99 TRINITY_DN3661_c0_g1_i9:203-970(+)
MFSSAITRHMTRAITFFLRRPTRYKKPILILMGAPGVGKGTFGRRLSRDWRMPLFSVGEYLRNAVKNNDSRLDSRIYELVRSGKPVKGEIVYKVVERRLLCEEEKEAKGVILDGFPKNVNQAKMLNKLGTVHAAINFFLADAVLIEKLAGRRECEQCNMTYNVAAIHRSGHDMDPILPLKDPERCDACGGQLMQRPDDEPTVVNDKLEVHRYESAPLERYYKEKGVYIEFAPRRGVKDYPEIRAKLEEFLKAKQK